MNSGISSCTQRSLIQPTKVLHYKAVGKEWAVWREGSFLMELLRQSWPRLHSSTSVLSMQIYSHLFFSWEKS